MPDFGPAFVALFWTSVIAVPLAIWKAIDVTIWAAGHISISFH